MRGMDRRSGELFSYVDLEKRVRPDHPLRAIRSISDEALEMLSEDFRDRNYPGTPLLTARG